MTHRGQGDEQATPAAGQPWGQPYAQDGYGQDYGQEYPQDAYQQPQQASYGYEQHGAPYGGAQPLPAEVPPQGSADATQFLPPTPGGAHEAAATQLIPPYPQQGPQRPDEQATQFIAPVPAQEESRQPPAEFDNLFRRPEGAGGPVVAESTQQLPQFGGPQTQAPQAAPYQQAPYGQGGYQQPGYQQGGYGQGSYDPQYPGGPSDGSWDRGEGQGGGKDRRKPAMLIAAVAGLAVVGLGVGALMSLGGGGGDGGTTDTAASASATASAPSGGQAKDGSDGARTQAEALDKLLGDSNNSREAVIGAVADIESCKDLDAAGGNLRDAAKQRRDLVTRLNALSIDQLPNHDALASALRTGWQASAEADDHYADWAQQAHGGKVCKGGHARHTNEANQGDTASGQATSAKNQASKLWNAIADKYGLTQRSSSQL